MNRHLFPLALLALLAAEGLARADPPLAIVAVGSGYEEAGTQPLPATLRDAAEMRRVLSLAGYKVLGKATAPEVDARGLTDLLVKQGRGERGLFYWSGHCRFVGGEGKEAGLQLRLAGGESFPFAKVLRGEGRWVYVLDCCHSARAAIHSAEKGQHFLLAAGRGTLRAGDGQTSPFTDFLIQGLTLGDLNADCVGGADLREAAQYVDAAFTGRRDALSRGQWTALKATGPGVPLLARLSDKARRRQRGRCAGVKQAARWLKGCVDQPGQAGASCPSFPRAVQERLRELLAGGDPGPLTRPIMLLGPLAPSVERGGRTLDEWLGKLGKKSIWRVWLRPGQVPGMAGPRFKLWLASLLSRFAVTLRLELHAMGSGAMVLEVIRQGSGEVLYSKRVARRKGLRGVTRTLYRDLARGVWAPVLDRLAPVGGLLEPRRSTLRVRFPGRPPESIRLRVPGRPGCPEVVTVNRGPGFSVSCGGRRGHCLELSLEDKCQAALAGAAVVELDFVGGLP